MGTFFLLPNSHRGTVPAIGSTEEFVFAKNIIMEFVITWNSNIAEVYL